MEITIFNGKIHYKWSFSIATLNYQRVDDMKTSHMIPLSFQPFGVLIPFGLPRRSVEKKKTSMD
jgi:hypothetical protein